MIAAAMLMVSAQASAQVGAPGTGELTAVNGISFGKVLVDEHVYTAAFRWTRMQPSALAFDASVATAPQALADGVALVGLHMGPALAIGLERGALLPKVGVGTVFVIARQDGAVTFSAYYGLGLVLAGTEGSGLRIDWSRHYVLGHDGGAASVIELGFVRSVG